MELLTGSSGRGGEAKAFRGGVATGLGTALDATVRADHGSA
jgi:hypothetical protein